MKNDKCEFNEKVEKIFALLVEEEGSREEALLRLLQYIVEETDVPYDLLLCVGSYFVMDLKKDSQPINFLLKAINFNKSVEAKRRAFCILVTGNCKVVESLNLSEIQKSILSVPIMTSALQNDSVDTAEVTMDYLYDSLYPSDSELFFALLQDIYDIMDEREDVRQKTWDNFQEICKGKPYENIVLGSVDDEIIH